VRKTQAALPLRSALTAVGIRVPQKQRMRSTMQAEGDYPTLF
jgi:hypothetical protein